MQRHRREHAHAVGFDAQRPVGFAGDEEVEPALRLRDVAGKRPPQFAGENLVAGFPDAVAGLELREINFAALEKERALAHFPDAPALFVVSIAAGIEHDAIARLDRRFAGHDDVIVGNRRDHANERAALGAVPGRHEGLVVDAVEPAGVQAAREGQLQFVPVVGGEFAGRGVNGFPVNLAGGGDVLGRFQPALDLEAGHAEPEQFRDRADRREVLR